MNRRAFLTTLAAVPLAAALPTPDLVPVTVLDQDGWAYAWEQDAYLRKGDIFTIESLYDRPGHLREFIVTAQVTHG